MSSSIVSRTLGAASRRSALSAARPQPVFRRFAATSQQPIKPTPVFSPALAGGSALVFGGLIYYAMFSDAPKKSEGAAHGHSSNTRKDLGMEHTKRVGGGSHQSGDGSSPSNEEAASIQQANAADAPKTAKKAEESDAGQSSQDGDESVAKPSIQQSLRADAPKTAKAAEEESSDMRRALDSDAPKSAYAAEERQGKQKMAA